jgi:hypothetical protein
MQCCMARYIDVFDRKHNNIHISKLDIRWRSRHDALVLAYRHGTLFRQTIGIFDARFSALKFRSTDASLHENLASS